MEFHPVHLSKVGERLVSGGSEVEVELSKDWKMIDR